MEHRTMRVEDVKPAPWNPPGRVTDKRLIELKNSIKERGILYPLLLGSDGLVADGHRRLSCAKLLGLRTVPVILAKEPAIELYEVPNTGQRRLTGAEWIHVYLEAPNAVPEKQRTYIGAIERELGREALELLKEHELGWSIYNDCAWLVRYCGREDSAENIWRALRWAIKHGASYYIRTVKEARPRPLSVWRLVEQDKKPPKLGRKIDA